MSAVPPGGALRLGVLVPCRNEAAVIERKLANLARLDWPGVVSDQRVVIVDDGSDDETASLAAALIEAHFAAAAAPAATLVRNDHTPGKAGAIAAGLAALGSDVDVVVLTDADVIFREDALSHVAAAFAANARLGMACGSQEFVADLADDGTPRGADGGPPVPAPGRYDRWTAAVRALESRGGRLFSVHGQLLAWRRTLALQPTPGIAADDLDLMVQVRRQGLRVEKLAAARFIEVKTPAGPDRVAQERRRAAAYFQVVGRCRLTADAPPLDRLHLSLYRVLPAAAPWLVLMGVLAALASATVWAGTTGLLVGLALLAAALSTPPGRRLARLLLVIDRARRHAARHGLADRWEMARG